MAADKGNVVRHRTYLLLVTALGEGAIGVALLVLPSVPLRLLLGVDGASPEAFFCARIAGAALLALGVVCWLGRNDPDRPAQQGLLLGVLIYDLAAAAILASTGWFSSLVGIALWPAAVLHVGLAAWCVRSMRT
jgi:hypothetical protein